MFFQNHAKLSLNSTFQGNVTIHDEIHKLCTSVPKGKNLIAEFQSKLME